MPELPEVHTTTEGLKRKTKGLVIFDVWSDYFKNTRNKNKEVIKNEGFFKKLKKEIVGERIVDAERKGKNILVHISKGKTILIHMKMTGHLMYGKYMEVKSYKVNKVIKSGQEKPKEKWEAVEEGPLQDSYNKFIHFLIQFKNGYSLAFSDMRKFAKITFFETKNKNRHPDLKILGPEPLQNLNWKILKNQLNKKPNGKIKTILMDQTVIAGIGNIYSDEILWASNIHPERKIHSITDLEIKNMLKNTIKILNKSIKLGGDSMSDYRNIDGEKGRFQNVHKVYRKTKQKCLKKDCGGIIERKIIGGRSAHFCPKHQINVLI